MTADAAGPSTTDPNPRTWPADVPLADLDFWSGSLEEREQGFARLRGTWPMPYYPEPESPLPAGPGFWALTRHADVAEASRRPEDFCSGQGATHIPDFPPEFAEFFGSIIEMDDPRHQRLRRIVSRAFTPRMIKKFESDVDATAKEIVDDVVERGACDFVTDVAARLPLKVICDMMGVPTKDHRFVFDRSNVILGVADPEYVEQEGGGHIEALLTAGAELAELMRDLAGFRRDNPTDDVTSALVNAEVDGESLTTDELASFFVLLLAAGNETTRNAISHGLRLVTEHPDQRELWLSNFERYTPTAVEEIVRLASPVVWMRRTATRDTDLNGKPVREGDKMLLFYWSANRDEAVFTDPLGFDITRDPNPHVGFGARGPHFCLGAHLARREITLLFRELFERLPDIRTVGEPQRLRSSFINGIKHMNCEFTPRPRA
ncbi:cytochrome P450 [Streptomyces sp. SID3343]|uniref:cytochrome P450 n=1 Tax=Streptomyces sp. SID3343 TaxID=2690260 RepID=UPI0013711F7F|nr:cytochrome P450 [Streptomyces sp. SID3343]MYW06534.1 cytochrome P450 [Streptomyces sp. SID3343]